MATERTVNLGELSDQIYAKSEEVDLAASKVKELEVEQRALEERLHNLMREAGTSVVKGQVGQSKITETVRPRIIDFEAFERFVLRKKALHLYERRIASAAYKELRDQMGGKPIPGTTEFIQERVKTTRA